MFYRAKIPVRCNNFFDACSQSFAVLFRCLDNHMDMDMDNHIVTKVNEDNQRFRGVPKRNGMGWSELLRLLWRT